MIPDEVVDDATEMVSAAYARKTGDSENPMTLQERLSALTEQQQELLEKVLDDMDNKELNAQMQALSEEKQILLAQIQAAQANELQQTTRQAQLDELKAFLKENSKGFTEYNDEVTRRIIEKITVVDAKTIRIRFKDSAVEIEQLLPDK